MGSWVRAFFFGGRVVLVVADAEEAFLGSEVE